MNEAATIKHAAKKLCECCLVIQELISNTKMSESLGVPHRYACAAPTDQRPFTTFLRMDDAELHDTKYKVLKSFLVLDKHSGVNLKALNPRVFDELCFPFEMKNTPMLQTATLAVPVLDGKWINSLLLDCPKEQVTMDLHRPMLLDGFVQMVKRQLRAGVSIQMFPHRNITPRTKLPNELEAISMHTSDYSYAAVPTFTPLGVDTKELGSFDAFIDSRSDQGLNMSHYHPIFTDILNHLFEMNKEYEPPLLYSI